MGLGITAYNGLQFVEVRNDPDWEDQDDKLVRFYVSDPFLVQAAGNIKDHGVYRFHQAMSFRAGSYSGYNFWRRQLAKLLGLEPEDIWRDPKLRRLAQSFRLRIRRRCGAIPLRRVLRWRLATVRNAGIRRVHAGMSGKHGWSRL